MVSSSFNFTWKIFIFTMMIKPGYRNSFFLLQYKKKTSFKEIGQPPHSKHETIVTSAKKNPMNSQTPCLKIFRAPCIPLVWKKKKIGHATRKNRLTDTASMGFYLPDIFFQWKKFFFYSKVLTIKRDFYPKMKQR